MCIHECVHVYIHTKFLVTKPNVMHFSVPFCNLTLCSHYSFALKFRTFREWPDVFSIHRGYQRLAPADVHLSSVLSLANGYFNLADGHLRSVETPHRHIARGL